MKSRTLTIAALILSASAFAGWVAIDERADVGANLAAQSAADEVRAFTRADIAFLGAGFLKDSVNRDDLTSLLQYPTDTLVVVSLTGEQVRQALERSVSLHPQPNQSFLQISGLDVAFRKGAAPNARIVSVTAGNAPLSDTKTYSVAMPSLLAKGGLGYFKIWDEARITKRFDNATMESVLRSKRITETTPRWTAQG